MNKDNSFCINYQYYTPTFIWDLPGDDYINGKRYHTIEEFYNKQGNIISTKYKLCTNDLKEYTSKGYAKKTEYKEQDLLLKVAQDRIEILNKILNKDFCKKEFLEDKNQTKINFLNDITFLYDNKNFLIGIDDSEYDFKISELVYFENNKKICIQFDKFS